GGVDDQQGGAVIVVEKAGVGVVEGAQVRRIDILLHRRAAVLDAFQQNLQRRLQVDHQVGYRGVDGELGVDILVKPQLIRVEGRLGKQRVFFHQKVGDAHRAENVPLAQRLQLLDPLEKKKQLGR